MHTMFSDKVATARPTHHRYATVNGRRVFYREAGDPALPTIVLLHGLPTSSQMFRNLIPALSDRFHLIAPDYIGFGHSDAPSNTEFTYTFDNLTAHVAGLIDMLGLGSYILYMQDYGGPVGFRLFTQAPDKVRGFVIQNTNAYIEGVGDPPKQALMPLWEKRTAETEQPAREFVSLEGTKFHWLVGAKDPDAINPDNWVLDQALLDRPGTQDYQVDLLENYKSNVALYPEWQAAFRQHRPKTLVVWGRHDPFFIPPGAEAFLTDLPDAKLVWLDSGHFVLDENTQIVAQEIKATFASSANRPLAYTSKVSIPLPLDAEIRSVVGPTYHPEKTGNFAKMFAGTGDLHAAMLGLDKAVFQAEGIDPKARQIIILRSAKVMDAPYEWGVNVLMATNHGFTADDIDKVASDGPVAGIDPQYILLCKATDEMAATATLADETLEQLLQEYGDALCRKYVAVICWFSFISRFVNSCRVPLETTDKIGSKTSPF